MDLSDVTAIVLAGGLGTRVRHLLPNIPKPMAPVAGKPFLEWVVRYLIHQGIRRIVLSTGYLAETIEHHFQQCPIPNCDITYCQEPVALGTAGGCLHAASQVLDSPNAWLVLNGDSLAFADITRLCSCLTEPGVEGVLLGVEVADATRYGRLTWDDCHILTGFTEKRPGAGVVNAGIYLFSQQLFANLPTILERSSKSLDKGNGFSALSPSSHPYQHPISFEYEVFPALIQSGVCLKVHPTAAAFLDIGTPETLLEAESFIQHHWKIAL